MRFRSQVMLIMTALAVATALGLGLLLATMAGSMMHRQLAGAGRAFTRVLAAQMDQKHELMQRLFERGQPPFPGEEGAVPPGPPPFSDKGATLPPGPPPEGGARADGPPELSLEKDLFELSQIIRARRIALVSPERVLGGVAPEGDSEDVLTPADIRELWQRLDEPSHERAALLESTTCFTFMAPLSNPAPDGTRLGLMVQLPKTLPRHILAAQAGVFVLAVVAVLLVAVVVAWFVSRTISRPLAQLAGAAEVYGRGILDQPAPVSGPVETHQLGEALNAMAGSLRQHIAELQSETSRREQIETELRVAADLQRSLLPAAGLHRLGPIEALGWSQPARVVGGDFYDYQVVKGDKVGFVIGDAAGHGIPAALLAAKCLSVIQALGGELDGPAALFDRANAALWRQFRGDGHFVTAVLGLFDPSTNRLHYSRAGHNPPLLARAVDGAVIPLADQDGLPLAATDNAAFTTTTLDLAEGDTLLLFTDGITESVDASGRMYGQHRLEEVFAAHRSAPLPELMEAVTADFQAHCGQEVPHDDCTALALRIHIGH